MPISASRTYGCEIGQDVLHVATWLGRQMDAVASYIIPRCVVVSAQMCVPTTAPVRVATKRANWFKNSGNFD